MGTLLSITNNIIVCRWLGFLDYEHVYALPIMGEGLVAIMATGVGSMDLRSKFRTSVLSCANMFCRRLVVLLSVAAFVNVNWFFLSFLIAFSPF